MLLERSRRAGARLGCCVVYDAAGCAVFVHALYVAGCAVLCCSYCYAGIVKGLAAMLIRFAPETNEVTFCSTLVLMLRLGIRVIPDVASDWNFD